MYYKNMLEDMIRDLSNQIYSYDKQIREMPAGTLGRNVVGEKNYYFQRLKPQGFRRKEKRVGISGNHEVIAGLARKRLLGEERKIAAGNLEVLERALKGYEPVDEKALIEGMKGAYGTLDATSFLGVPAVARHEDENTFREESLIHRTPSGLRVRSKSELVIASRLEHFGIKFDYEPLIYVGGRPFRPDFKPISKRDPRAIYWEHAGMMGDSSYMANYQEKLQVYYENGLVPWENLILTYDNEDGGLDVRVVDAMIKGWLL